MSTTNITISNPGTATIGGVALSTLDRVLLAGQTAGAENGIYIFNGSASAMTRASDADTNAKVTSGMYTFVTEGTGATQGWILTTPDPITLGTTTLTFAQFNGGQTYTAGSGIALSGNQIVTDSASLLRGLHTLASNGILVKTGSNTVANRSIAVPTGMSISNADGVAGNPTIALANDLAALEGLGGTGFATRTAADTWTQRTMTGTGNQISVTNGDGVAGAPTFAIVSDPVIPGNLGMVIPSGTTAQETLATDGAIRFDTQTLRLRQRYNGTYKNIGSGDGTVTSVAVSGSTGLTVGSSPITSSGTITLTLGAELQGLSGLAANGIVVRTGAGAYSMRSLTQGTGISITNADGTAGNITIANTGVTSVGLSLPTQFNVTTATVTTTGTLTAAWNTQTANLVFAGPASGGAAAPTFRSLAYLDLPIKLFVENPSTPTAPTATGANSVAIGSGAAASAIGALALGDGSSGRVQGGTVDANGKFVTAGDAQIGEYILRNITSTAAVTELFIDGASVRLAMPNFSAFMVTVSLVARRTDVADGAAAHKHEFLIRRDATPATTAIVGNVSKTVVGETNSTWDSVVSADTTNGSIKVTVTGEAAKTIRWVAKVSTVEVTN